MTTERHCLICLGLDCKKIWMSTSTKQTGDLSPGLSSGTVTLMFCSLELHHQVVPPEQNTDRWRGAVVVGVPRNDIQYVCPLLVTTAQTDTPHCVKGFMGGEMPGKEGRKKGREERIEEGKNVGRKEGSQKNKIKEKILIHFYYCFITLIKTIKTVCLCLLISHSLANSTRKSYFHIVHLIYCQYESTNTYK